MLSAVRILRCVATVCILMTTIGHPVPVRLVHLRLRGAAAREIGVAADGCEVRGCGEVVFRKGSHGGGALAVVGGAVLACTHAVPCHVLIVTGTGVE